MAPLGALVYIWVRYEKKIPLEWQDGYIIPPTNPGLGVELDEDVATANPYKGEAIFPEMEEQPIL